MAGIVVGLEWLLSVFCCSRNGKDQCRMVQEAGKRPLYGHFRHPYPRWLLAGNLADSGLDRRLVNFGLEAAAPFITGLLLFLFLLS